MDVKTILEVLEVMVAVFQVIIILFLAGIKGDIRDIWKRLYGHYHLVDCDNPDCNKLKTGDVIVPHGSE